jgi:signal transduction histidine kinase
MEAIGRREVGRTLGWGKGFPQLSTSVIGHRLRRAALTLAAIAAFVAGTSATSAALAGITNAGVEADPTGSEIVAVSPAGFAWRDGIRPGQHIVAVAPSDAAGGWSIETELDGQQFHSNEGPTDQALRESLPLALMGLALGSFAILFLRTHRHWALPAACAGLFISSIPLLLYGNPDLSAASMAAAMVVPSLWVSGRGPWPNPIRIIAAVGAIGFILVWYWSRSAGSATYDSLEQIRGLLAIVALGAVVAARTLAAVGRGEIELVTRPRLVDAAAAASLTGLALVLVYFWAVSPVVIAGVLLIGIVVLPPLRRLAWRRLEEILMADRLQEVASDALEQERARIARELHDAPLQRIQAVIRRLELLPEATNEIHDLQEAAAQLRAVATDLRPPVLDDLGLSAALEFLSEEVHDPAISVSAAINDAGLAVFGRRPPPDVELAMFRIAQEAVGNAMQHAQATTVAIVAHVTPTEVDLTISDDGMGVSPDAAAVAGSRGHLGLASMRRRAQAIGAEFSIDGSSRGTVVHVAWQQ